MTENKVIYLTIDEAISVLRGDKIVHCFVSGGMLIGADWDKEGVEEYIRNSKTRVIGQGMCRGMGHGLVVDGTDGLKFFETDEVKLLEMEAKKCQKIKQK